MNASCSMFSQILKLIPRIDFQQMVKETGAEQRNLAGLPVSSPPGRGKSLRPIGRDARACRDSCACEMDSRFSMTLPLEAR